VRLLNLAAGEAAFNRQVEAGERESRPNRGSRLTNMLGAVGIDQMLVDERRIAMGERVVGQLMHQGATLAGGVRLSIRFKAKGRALQAASRANDQHREMSLGTPSGLDRTMSLVQANRTAAPAELEGQLEQYRPELIGYCYRMLGSPFEAEDAVQETLLRAWRGYERFEGRAAVRSWIYRIATNVCLDMVEGRNRRARPMDLGPARAPVETNAHWMPEVAWLEPIPDSLLAEEGDPAELAVMRESIRLAFVAALQHLPPRQRAVLILCEVLRWRAKEVAELLKTSVPSVNSALQRARETLEASGVSANDPVPPMDDARKQLLARYVQAFERYDLNALTSLIKEDARQSMPPYDLWLRGRDNILAWWFGPGIGCRGSRLLPTSGANGCVAFGQYKPSQTGSGRDPWSLLVVETEGDRIGELTFFLDTARLFPLFGLPPHVD